MINWQERDFWSENEKFGNTAKLTPDEKTISKLDSGAQQSLEKVFSFS